MSSAKTRVKAPAFQWYPGDFRRDSAVQSCSFEARALWREMLDFMHDGEPRGYLASGGVGIDIDQLARFVGVSRTKVARWLQELDDRKVFSRTEDGVIYSRRMVRDEHVSQVRRDAGKLGGNPDLVKQTGENADGLVNQTPKPAPKKSVRKRTVLLNQKGKQNPTPAVAVAVATALPQQRSLGKSDSVDRPVASAATRDGPLPLRSLSQLLRPLPNHTHKLFVRHYDLRDVTEDRKIDVARQLAALFAGQAVRDDTGGRVTAYGVERLERKAAEVNATVLTDANAAIVVLLRKLGDTSDVSADLIARENADVQEAERVERAQQILVDEWVRHHPDDASTLRAKIAAEYPGDGPFFELTRESAFVSAVVRRLPPSAQAGAA